MLENFVLNLKFHMFPIIHSNYYVNLTQDEYVRK